ncbi:glycosyl transferase family 2 [Clostridium sp. CAG:452]|nr:glycosyl transferase family 2 [Clostridium sp. CAG:452]
MEEDLVSIVTPTYNCGKFIAETIESVIEQTYKNWEMIIVDDCSKDDTQTIVGKYIKNNKRIKYIKFEKNQGAAIARNVAIKEAKGKYIAFLDSDDLWSKDKLEKQIGFMKKNNYNFSYTNYEEIDEKSMSLNIQVTGPKKITKAGMYNYCWPGCLTVIYNAEKVGRVQIENLPKNNDYAMWLKVIKKSKCYLLNENLAKYRIRQGSISRNKKLQLIKYHYILYRYGEKMNIEASIFNTLRNIFFGVIKKFLYRKVGR